MMKLSIIFVIAVLFLSSCSEYTFQAVDDNGSHFDPISTAKSDFFTIKYNYYKGTDCKVGGTLNEIAIRNSSTNELIVDDIKLNQFYDGKNITLDQAPTKYVNGCVICSNRERTERIAIKSNEWMFFSFPIKECNNFKLGDKIDLEFTVEMHAGNKKYINKVTFIKVVTKTEMSWL